MKLFATCKKNLEPYLESELKEYNFKNIQKYQEFCTADINSKDDMIKFSYLSNFSIRVGLLIKNTDLNNIDTKNILSHLKNKQTFRIDCTRSGTHNFNSKEFADNLSDKIKTQLNININYKDPDIIILTKIIDNNLLIGIDYCGFELNIRDYKIFNSPDSIKGDIASIISHEALKKLKSGIILDPLCNDGTIIIETALKNINLSHNFYRKDNFIFNRYKKNSRIILEELDKKTKKNKIHIHAFDDNFNNIQKTRKNMIIAGIKKELDLRKIDLKDIDLKFKDKSVDRIITYTKKPNNILLDQSHLILKDKGLLIILTKNNIKEFQNFKIKKTISIDNNRTIYILNKIN